MRRTLALVVVAAVLIGGCGGGSDDSKSGGGGNGSSSSSEPSAGDTQYLDPFQSSKSGDVCLSKREVQRKIFSIASRVQNSERKQKAIQAVKDRAC